MRCALCGAEIKHEPHYLSGMPICTGCYSAHHDEAEDIVPCQRCGFRIPRHEVRYLHTRMYCIYCFNELQEEEEWMKERIRKDIERREAARKETEIAIERERVGEKRVYESEVARELHGTGGTTSEQNSTETKDIKRHWDDAKDASEHFGKAELMETPHRIAGYRNAITSTEDRLDSVKKGILDFIGRFFRR